MFISRIVSFLAATGISFTSAFLFSAENEQCFPVCLQYTSQKVLGLGLGLVFRCKVLVLVWNNGLDFGFCIDFEIILKS